MVAVIAADALAAWTESGRALGTVTQATPADAAAILERRHATVIDVREEAEWAVGHLPGVTNIPLGHLAERLHELPSNHPVVLHCQSGARSSIAASLLKAHDGRDVVNLAGGFTAWRQAGFPVATEQH